MAANLTGIGFLAVLGDNMSRDCRQFTRASCCSPTISRTYP